MSFIFQPKISCGIKKISPFIINVFMNETLLNLIILHLRYITKIAIDGNEKNKVIIRINNVEILLDAYNNTSL